ncbi:papain family cysteine protease [Helicosporidium sp. ATCC 50920]|nr:papain family cysteine protease [Helicosporidium sp. ATCC 50920]|eukprot:KDD75077.1 papain family cysteine protease [Helicosporidium sp. ATCC 50920]
MAINQFADMSEEEFTQKVLGLNTELEKQSTQAAPEMFRYSNANVPAKMDWVKEGAVTDVKNQLIAVGAIEGINYIKTKELTSLSVQQLVDCDHAYNMGCGGGLMSYAFDYVHKNGGIDTDEDYSYWSVDLACQTAKQGNRHMVSIDGYEEVPKNDTQALLKAVSNQPVSVGICANSNLQFYSSGVVDEPSCCSQMNHGVLVVGFENDGPQRHWKIKNSWGTGWGEEGYFRAAMDAQAPSGTCGLLQMPAYPVKKTAKNPEHSELCGYFGMTMCEPHASCLCEYSFFDLVCLSWGCQAH